MHLALIAVGNFFFKHRNWAFPVLIACVVAVGIPPSDTFGSSTLEHVKDGAAIILALTGLALRALVIGHRYVMRSGRNRAIQADELFVDGLFSLCRNPLYTGNVLVVCGIFLMHGNPYAVVIGPAVFIAIYRAMIAAEEDYLTGRFGAVFVDYCARMPRWIPNVLRLSEVLRGRPFVLRRVLIVEYTNIGLTVLALAALEFYEEIEEPLASNGITSIAVLLGIGAAAVVWIATMRALKKNRILVAS